MHHSDDESKETAVITCYLDESGTDDLSPTAVVGGVLMDKPRFISFDSAWRSLLDKHKIPFVHMKEFGPHGKLGHLTVEERRSLFGDAVPFINRHKIISIAARLTTAEYDKHLASVLDRKTMGVYGACFILCVVFNHKLAAQKQYKKDIAFLMDTGNAYRHHVLEAHRTIVQFQKKTPLNAGALAFGDDEEYLVLQAADMVSWTVRRKITGTFPPGFEPLSAILGDDVDRHHAEAIFSEELLVELGEMLKRKIEESNN